MYEQGYVKFGVPFFCPESVVISVYDVLSATNYEQIKALAKQTRCSVNELIVLAPQNDPFYTGTPGDKALGEWFARLWEAFGYDRGVHIRRVHYQVVSQDPPVEMPNGKPYENTVECWDVLNMASKAARYLRLVDPAAFDDRRNPGTLMYARHQVAAPDIRLAGRLYQADFQLPDFPSCQRIMWKVTGLIKSIILKCGVKRAR